MKNNDLQILTNYILSFKFLEDFNTDLIEKWVIELINEGYNSDSIFMLASFTKPIDYYEIIPYLNKVFQDLDLKEHEENLASKSCISYYLNLIVNGTNVRSNLSDVIEFYYQFNLESEINDLYLLHFAWQDLYGEGVTYYYDNVTLENIEQTVIEKAKQCLAENL